MSPDARAEIQSLLARLANGDRSALDPAFRALWPVVVRFTARALAHPTDAEDAAQEAIVKTFAQVASFDARRDGVAWALTIAAWECRTVRKRRLRRREGASDLETPLSDGSGERAGSPEDLVVERDLLAAAKEALGTLRETDVQTILLAMSEERGAAGSGATFRKRLERALGRLRLAWRTKHGSE